MKAGELHAVYLVGASGVGKTTLLLHIAQAWGLEQITGATRRALGRLGLDSWEAMDGSLDVADAYQRAVWAEQLALEQCCFSAGQRFVSDRSFDLAVYTARQARVAADILESHAFKLYMNRLKGRGLVFFVRPHPGVQAARDGRRDRFLTPEWQYRIDGALELFLEAWRVPYVSLDTASFKDRCRTVEAVLTPLLGPPRAAGEPQKAES